MLNFDITFFFLAAYFHPQQRDNVIRDEVLYVSYQFSFERKLRPFTLRNTARRVSQIYRLKKIRLENENITEANEEIKLHEAGEV